MPVTIKNNPQFWNFVLKVTKPYLSSVWQQKIEKIRDNHLGISLNTVNKLSRVTGLGMSELINGQKPNLVYKGFDNYKDGLPCNPIMFNTIVLADSQQAWSAHYLKKHDQQPIPFIVQPRGITKTRLVKYYKRFHRHIGQPSFSNIRGYISNMGVIVMGAYTDPSHLYHITPKWFQGFTLANQYSPEIVINGNLSLQKQLQILFDGLTKLGQRKSIVFTDSYQCKKSNQKAIQELGVKYNHIDRLDPNFTIDIINDLATTGEYTSAFRLLGIRGTRQLDKLKQKLVAHLNREHS